MRIIKKLFTVPSDEKITEKNMMCVLISTVCSVSLCMACLASTTWAWYTATVTSESNVLQIGDWTPAGSIQETEETTEATEQTTEATEETTEATEVTTEETTEVTEQTTEATEEATEAVVEETTQPTLEEDQIP